MPEPIELSKSFKILDYKKFFETQKSGIERNMADPFNRIFQTNYWRLIDLKKFIEK